LIAEGDKVVVRLRWHSTDLTGKTLDRETIDIIRLANGQMVEHWGAEAWSSENGDETL
jgi:predicted SnoaL-like aldol condensation-catalyzing enzyme